MLGLVVTVTVDEVELASDVLWSLGVVAIEERNNGDDIELWTSLGDDHDTVLDAAQSALPWPWRTVELDLASADTWRQFAAPTWVAPDLVFCPAWVDVEFPPGASPDAVTIVKIEPGATFGMGDHPTTVLTALLMHERDLAGLRVLDVGCGSGVLAVAACLLGAREAEGIDIAPAAIGTTEANAAANGVGERVTVSCTPLADVDGPFDLVLANILAPALIELAPDLRRVLAPGGSLVISGILADNHEHVLAALAPLRVTHTVTRDVWAAIELLN